MREIKKKKKKKKKKRRKRREEEKKKKKKSPDGAWNDAGRFRREGGCMRELTIAPEYQRARKGGAGSEKKEWANGKVAVVLLSRRVGGVR